MLRATACLSFARPGRDKRARRASARASGPAPNGVSRQCAHAQARGRARTHRLRSRADAGCWHKHAGIRCQGAILLAAWLAGMTDLGRLAEAAHLLAATFRDRHMGPG